MKSRKCVGEIMAQNNCVWQKTYVEQIGKLWNKENADHHVDQW